MLQLGAAREVLRASSSFLCRPAVEAAVRTGSMLVTGSIARSANLPVFSLLRGQF